MPSRPHERQAVAIAQRIADDVIGDSLPVVADQLILPRIIVAVTDCRSIDRFGSKISTVVVIVRSGDRAVDHTLELVVGVIGIGVGRVADGHRGDIAVVIIGIGGSQQCRIPIFAGHGGGDIGGPVSAHVEIGGQLVQVADCRDGFAVETVELSRFIDAGNQRRRSFQPVRPGCGGQGLRLTGKAENRACGLCTQIIFGLNIAEPWLPRTEKVAAHVVSIQRFVTVDKIVRIILLNLTGASPYYNYSNLIIHYF